MSYTTLMDGQSSPPKKEKMMITSRDEYYQACKVLVGPCIYYGNFCDLSPKKLAEVEAELAQLEVDVTAWEAANGEAR